MEKLVKTRKIFDAILKTGEEKTHLKRAISELNKAFDYTKSEEFIHKESWKHANELIVFVNKKTASFTKDFLEELKGKYDIELNEELVKNAFTNKVMTEISYQRKDWI
jgi:hypothetical protein